MASFRIKDGKFLIVDGKFAVGDGTCGCCGCNNNITHMMIGVINTNGITDDDFELRIDGNLIATVVETDVSGPGGVYRGNIYAPTGCSDNFDRDVDGILIDVPNEAGGTPGNVIFNNSATLIALTNGDYNITLDSVVDNTFANYGQLAIWGCDASCIPCLISLSEYTGGALVQVANITVNFTDGVLTIV